MSRQPRLWLGRARGLLVVLLGAAVALAGEPPKKFTEAVTNAKGKKVTFDMVLIPGGTFVMGSPDDEDERRDDEGPPHKVQLKPFYMCTTEATLDLFMIYYSETVKSTRDDHEKKDGKRVTVQDPALPVEHKDIDNLKLAKIYSVDAVGSPTPVYGDLTMGWGAGKRPAIAPTWLNAVNVCRWLSKKTGKHYRLPTEAEWEYACRAGTKTPYSFGEDDSDIDDFAWYEDNSDEKTQPVAQRKPNAWGLYDMHGNVMEWCHDFYAPATYASAKTNPAKAPLGPKLPTLPKGKKRLERHERYHVARGGAWNSPAEELRCAARAKEDESWRYKDPQFPKSLWWLPEMSFVGFRVVCDVDSVVKK